MKDSHTGLTDEELIWLAQKGEREAFEELVERYKKKSYSLAFGFAQDREEAKDLSQEAFLRAYRAVKTFDGRSSFYTWFYRILVNLCLDYRRRRERGAWESLDGAGESGAREPRAVSNGVGVEEELKDRIRRAVEDLTPKQRAAFILKHHHGLSVRDIAKVMRTAEGTVKAHIHRAVVTLRESLRGC